MYLWGSDKGFFFKITYSEEARRLHIYNYGCNLKCTWCYYRLKPPLYDKKLDINDIIRVLREYKSKADRVNILGGEPTINPNLRDVVENAKKIDYKVRLISNGSNIPPKGIDEANVSIKLYSDDLSIKYCGIPASIILDNVRKMYEMGIQLYISTIYIPEFNFNDIIEISKFISSLNKDIPFHIIGYIPVPNAPWRKPTLREVEELAFKVKRYLRKVSWSCKSANEVRYSSIRVA